MAGSGLGRWSSGRSMRDTAIFLGPTLPRADAQRVLDADYLPPICRGDLALLPGHIRFVGIIDGEFFQSLSVSPKEVLTLLRRGVTVCGASSMGALRAAETWRFGMIGIGTIFRMFRDGVLDADDELALVYHRDTERHTFRASSDPLVNLRAALDLASSAHVIDESEKADLIQRLKALYFPERSLGALYSFCPKLRRFFAHTTPPDPKREDAIELLHTIRSLKANAPPVDEQAERLIEFGAPGRN